MGMGDLSMGLKKGQEKLSAKISAGQARATGARFNDFLEAHGARAG
jgi:hypothetical protein